MAFSIRFCPYCGADTTTESSGQYVCTECDRRIVRSRSNSNAFLMNKPYADEYSDIISQADTDPEKALKRINSVIDGSELPDTDMFFTRGLVYAALGEEGKAHIDWSKGLELMTDTRFLDAYIVAVCSRIVELICQKEREFKDFNPIEYIDQIATEFRLKGETPCKGVFYITIYRNFRMDQQAGAFNDNDIYETIIPKILRRILAYGRNFKTVVSIVEEILEDFEYDPETYEEDDNLSLHVCYLLIKKYEELSKDFSDEHLIRIFRHWNDENMFELEYWIGELLDSVRDSSLLQTFSKFRKTEGGDVDLQEAVDDYAKKMLLLSDDGEDLSEEA